MTEPDMTNFEDLRKTLDKAANVIAAFASIHRSNETPLPSLLEAASKTGEELSEWHEFYGQIIEMFVDERRH